MAPEASGDGVRAPPYPTIYSPWLGFEGLIHWRSMVSTAAAPASEVEAVVRSPTNMAAAKIAAVDFSKMMPK